MSEREYEIEFAVTLHVTDRGDRPDAEQVGRFLLAAAPTLAAEGVDLTNVSVEEAA